MSITTDRAERDEAKVKLAEKTDEQLLDDLGYWAVAVANHQDDFTELTRQSEAIGDLYNEAQAWVGLITEQLQARRRKARAES